MYAYRALQCMCPHVMSVFTQPFAAGLIGFFQKSVTDRKKAVYIGERLPKDNQNGDSMDDAHIILLL